MNPMMQILAQQRIDEMHRAAADDRLSRAAQSARADNVEPARRWRRRAQPVCAT